MMDSQGHRGWLRSCYSQGLAGLCSALVQSDHVLSRPALGTFRFLEAHENLVSVLRVTMDQFHVLVRRAWCGDIKQNVPAKSHIPEDSALQGGRDQLLNLLSACVVRWDPSCARLEPEWRGRWALLRPGFQGTANMPGTPDACAPSCPFLLYFSGNPEPWWVQVAKTPHPSLPAPRSQASLG